MSLMNRRFGLTGFFALLLVVIWGARLLPYEYQDYPKGAWTSAKDTIKGHLGSADGSADGSDGSKASPVPPAASAPSAVPADAVPADAVPADIPASDSVGRNNTHVQAFFEQTFALPEPPLFPFTELKAACAAADWDHNEAYLNCVGMMAGMTTIMSMVKTCLKMAIETGNHLVLPRIPLRSSTDLKQFNFMNGDAYMPYDKWYDAHHLTRQMAAACPQMRIIHPDNLDNEVAVRHRFQILCKDALFYRPIHSYFWVGRPYAKFFNDQFGLHMLAIQASADAASAAVAAATPAPSSAPALVPAPASATDAAAAPASPASPAVRGLPEALDGKPYPQDITLVEVDSNFLLFRILDDPTRRDLRLWTELTHLVRFHDDVRTVIDRVLHHLPPQANYFGVHYRAENDSIWSSPEHQLTVDLDALDHAWTRFGNYGEPKPAVYLACGDQAQADRFAAAAAERGWAQTTDKWKVLQEAGDADTLALLDGLAFDFQGAVDLGIMLQSRFFLGVQGSAFSSTIGNHRDVSGRYRGSSFDVPDDGARTHLFNDGDASEYACCL